MMVILYTDQFSRSGSSYRCGKTFLFKIIHNSAATRDVSTIGSGGMGGGGYSAKVGLSPLPSESEHQNYCSWKKIDIQYIYSNRA